MAFFNRYKANPLGLWKAGDGINLEFDGDNHAISGVKLRDPAAMLLKFGRPDSVDESNGIHSFFSLGFQAGISDNRVIEFVIFWNDLINCQFRPFPGSFIFHGRKLDIKAGLDEAKVNSLLGEPFWESKDKDEIILFYEWGVVEWQVCVNLQSGLYEMTVTALPLLADASQRQAYGVNRPWLPKT